MLGMICVQYWHLALPSSLLPVTQFTVLRCARLVSIMYYTKTQENVVIIEHCSIVIFYVSIMFICSSENQRDCCCVWHALNISTWLFLTKLLPATLFLACSYRQHASYQLSTHLGWPIITIFYRHILGTNTITVVWLCALSFD